MKLRIFHSAEGDCLLLQSEDGKNILCDGGRASTMKKHVRKQLADLVDDGMLDYIYVSHVDQDHIHGIQQLLEDALDWRVFDHHQDAGDTSVNEPDCPRPPAIGGIWHNSFGDQVDKNTGDIADLLAQSAPVLFATGIPQLEHIAYEAQNIAASIPQALRVSKLCQSDLLDIPINKTPDTTGPAKLLIAGEDTPRRFNVGSLTITIIGPTSNELENLRDGWNNWLNDPDNLNALNKIKGYIRKQLDRFANGNLDSTPFDLGSWNGIPAFKGVTTPNVASLVLMVEENGKRMLLTGDDQQDTLLEGLVAAGFMDEGDDGHIHLDVLKVQHHGSEHNMDANFAKRVSADHYVFCGDGSSGNPEPEVIDFIYKSRLGVTSRRALAEKAKDRPFTFWFSSKLENLPLQSSEHANFKKTMQKVEKRQADSGGLMRVQFVNNNYRTLTV